MVRSQKQHCYYCSVYVCIILCKYMILILSEINNVQGRIEICYTRMPGRETLGKDTSIVQ